MKTTPRNESTLAKGFSLVEMLVVIAVIGVIAAIAIPNVGAIHDGARKGTAMRNAQNISVVWECGSVAGMPGNATGPGRLWRTASDVVLGATLMSSSEPNKLFMLPNIKTADLADAEKFLDYSVGIKYNPNGVWP